MTDNILYFDEQGYPCDDYRDIHEAIEETTKMLLSMTREERIDVVSQKQVSVSHQL